MKNELNKILILSCILLFVSSFNTSVVFSQVSHSVNFSKKIFRLSSYKPDSSAEYETIQMDKLHPSIKEVGVPELPVKIVRLIVPAGQEVNNIVVNVKNKEVIKLQKKIKPVQYDIPTSINHEHPQFVNPKKEIYESDQPFPEHLIKVLNSGYFDGTNHIVTLAVYPVAYIPKKDELEFYHDISFTLEMKQGGKKAKIVNNRSDKKQEHINAILRNMVDNP